MILMSLAFPTHVRYTTPAVGRCLPFAPSLVYQRIGRTSATA